MRDLLEGLEVTQSAAARYFGVHRNTVARWCEFGAPDAVVMVLKGLVDDLLDAEMELRFASDRIRDLREA